MNKRFTSLQLSTFAKNFYDSAIGKRSYGMEKYVATDGENAMFVKSDYEPQSGEAVFYIKRVYGGELYCQLYKSE